MKLKERRTLKEYIKGVLFVVPTSAVILVGLGLHENIKARSTKAIEIDRIVQAMELIQGSEAIYNPQTGPKEIPSGLYATVAPFQPFAVSTNGVSSLVPYPECASPEIMISTAISPPHMWIGGDLPFELYAKEVSQGWEITAYSTAFAEKDVPLHIQGTAQLLCPTETDEDQKY